MTFDEAFDDEVLRMLTANYLRESERRADELIVGDGTGEPRGLVWLLGETAKASLDDGHTCGSTGVRMPRA